MNNATASKLGTAAKMHANMMPRLIATCVPRSKRASALVFSIDAVDR